MWQLFVERSSERKHKLLLPEEEVIVRVGEVKPPKVSIASKGLQTCGVKNRRTSN